MRELEIYVHIPFCVRKCAYCDFLSAPASTETMRAYMDALLEEIRQFPLNRAGLEDNEAYRIRSVFFGGGTPSVLPAEWIGKILDVLEKKFGSHHILRKQCEISIECNPGTAGLENLTVYRSMGIRRISFGLQSADNRELALLGRIHTWEAFLETWDACRRAGFTNCNIDLMCALPGQTVESWERTLRQVLSLRPEHLSVYSLIIEEGTPFFERYAQDVKLREAGATPQFLPSEEAERDMVHGAKQMLEHCGYRQYELSNYSLPGYECVHNTGYWTGTEYLGFGLGAASCMRVFLTEEEPYGAEGIQNPDEGKKEELQKTGTEVGMVRWKNREDLTDYITSGKVPGMTAVPAKGMTWNEKMDTQTVEFCSPEVQMEEFMFLGLRMTQGISEKEFLDRFGVSVEKIYGSVIEKHMKNGLLEKDGEKENTRIRLTGRGMDVANYVMADFLF